AVSDPVGSGFVSSFRRPGGNLTGFLLYEEGIVGKWIAMLKEVVPTISRVGILGADSSVFPYFWAAATAPAASLALALEAILVNDLAEVEHGIEVFTKRCCGGLVFLPAPLLMTNRARVITLLNVHQVPAVFANREFVRAGGLMSYDIDTIDMYRRSAGYVDR